MTRKNLQVYPMNRVEGDLKIQIEMTGNVVTEAFSQGTMYRGFENILLGRGALDGLVITPRICGICTTSHLYAAAKALDMIYAVDIPDDAKRIRNVTLMTEMIQNDIRHAFLIFMIDFTHPVYQNHSLFGEAQKRFSPMKGKTYVEVVDRTKKLIEIIAILGGQWPHSSFMVPGGIVSIPSYEEIMTCQHILADFKRWYENEVLGCDLATWSHVKSKKDLELWLKDPSHQDLALGFFIRFAREAGLDRIGIGHGHYLSFGTFDMPRETLVTPKRVGHTYLPSGGWIAPNGVAAFDQDKVSEDVSHAWFGGPERALHPFKSKTQPYATGSERQKYSWVKAPRYEGMPFETGPLAELLIAGDPLFTDLVNQEGGSALVRQMARMVRPAIILPVFEQWLKEISCQNKEFFKKYQDVEQGEGMGLIQAPRGALGHWVKLDGGKISSYQIITPSSWNASPRDRQGVRGPWEEALIGTQIKDPENLIEIDHILRSFDPCMVCSVHVCQPDFPTSEL